VTVADLKAGIALLVVDGDPGEAVQLSAIVPGTVIPVQSNGRTLVDGGVPSVVPVGFVHAMGADVVIAVDVFCSRNPPLRGNAVETLLKAVRLQSCLISEAETQSAEVLIRPEFEPDDPVSFAHRDAAIAAGYAVALAAVPKIRERLGAPPRQSGDDCSRPAKAPEKGAARRRSAGRRKASGPAFAQVQHEHVARPRTPSAVLAVNHDSQWRLPWPMTMRSAPTLSRA